MGQVDIDTNMDLDSDEVAVKCQRIFNSLLWKEHHNIFNAAFNDECGHDNQQTSLYHKEKWFEK